MTVKHEPQTPLPWRLSEDSLRIVGGRYQAGQGNSLQDALYIVRAANAYPRLVVADDLWRQAAQMLEATAHGARYDAEHLLMVAKGLRELAGGG